MVWRRVRLGALFFGTATLVASSASSAHAASYYVATDGDDGSTGTEDQPWASLEKAESVVQPGDTVFVRGGTYNEIRIEWRASGTAAAPITIQAYPGETPVFDGENDRYSFMNIRAADWVIIDGLHARNYGTGASRDSAAGCFWVGYTPDDNNFAEHVTFQNVRAENCGSNSHAHVLYVSYGVRDLTVRNSHLSRSFGGCIHQWHEPGVQGFKLYNNVLAECHWGAILANGATDVEIYNNTFFENEAGLEMRHSGQCDVGPCGDSDYGVFNVSVHNNIFYQTGDQSQWGMWIGEINIERESVTTDHNDIFVTQGTPIRWGDQNVSLEEYVGLSGNGMNSLAEDPRFVDRSGADFHLQEGSPAVDRGTEAAWITDDLEGNARPQGAGYDLGAFEYPDAQVPAETVFSTVPFYGDRMNYSERTPSRWAVVEDGGDLRYALRGNEGIDGGLGEVSVVAGRTFGDFTMTLSARTPDDLAEWADYAVVFGYQDPENYYAVLFNSNQTANGVHLVEGGEDRELFDLGEALLTDNAYHQIEVSRTGAEIVVRFDGAEKMRVSDTSFGVGAVGVGSIDNRAFFDDIDVMGDNEGSSSGEGPGGGADGGSGPDGGAGADGGLGSDGGLSSGGSSGDPAQAGDRGGCACETATGRHGKSPPFVLLGLVGVSLATRRRSWSKPPHGG